MKKAAIFFNATALLAVLLVMRGEGGSPWLSGQPIAFPASSGSLDSTFAADGKVALRPGDGGGLAQAVAIQADGKIVTVGYALVGPSSDFAVTRTNPDGSLDFTFDGDGIALTPIGPSGDEAFGVTIQNDGKIVVVGQASNGMNADLAIVRYNTDGSLDTAFDGDGKKMIDVAGSNDLGRSVVVQSDGKIVVAGNSLVSGNSDITLIRLEANGALDPSFSGNPVNGNGVVITQVGAGSDLGFALAAQPDGKLLVAGYYTGPASTDSFILRFGPTGVLDPSFSGDGKAAIAFSPDDVDEALAMALQSDGRIVIAGCIRGGGQLNDHLVARLNTNGDLDQSFGTGGFTRVQFSPNPDIAFGVAIQTDGKIITAGFASNGSNFDYGVSRLHPNGMLDTTFHGDGQQLTMFGTSVDTANAVAIQADGKIVVVGRTVIDGIPMFGLARYGYGTNQDQNDGFFVLDPATAVRFDNAFRAGTSSSTLLNTNAVPPVGTGWTVVDSPRSFETTALFTGNVTVRITLPANVDGVTFEAIRLRQHVGGDWVDVTAPAPARDFSTRTIYASLTSPGIVAAALPVAGVSGRVTTPSGLGLRNAVVTIIDSSGNRRTASTSSFGNYTFEGLPSGQTYTMSVASKRYRFASRIVQLSGNAAEINFEGLE